MSAPGGPGAGDHGAAGEPGPVDWDVADRMASWVAAQAGRETPGTADEAHRLAELGRVAELHVAAATGLAPGAGERPVRVVGVTRTEWARRSLARHRSLLERLAVALGFPDDADAAAAEGGTGWPAEAGDVEATTDAVTGQPPQWLLGGGEGDPSDPLGRLSRVPPRLAQGFVFGWMFGHLAQRALGQYDLPLPGPDGDEIMVVPTNLDRFAADWGLPADEVRLWVCLRDVAHHAVLHRPHVRSRVESLLGRYVSGFDVDPDAFAAELEALDVTDRTSFQQVLGDPEKVVEAVRSPAQLEVLPLLDAVTAVVTGYVDHLMDKIAPSLLPSYPAVTEALRRWRVEASWGDRYVAKLLGLEMRQVAHERGDAFVRGVIERAGEGALGRLWKSERALPTPAEVNAPGLWLARIDLAEEGEP